MFLIQVCGFRIKPKIDEDKREKYSELFSCVTHKPGIFEVDRCIVSIDSDIEYDLEVTLKGKMELTLDKYLALKEYLEFFGFKVY